MWRTMCSGGRGLIPLCAALLIACGGELPSKQPGTVLPPTPLCAASDPAQVVAPQRIALLTSTQLMNMIRLVSDEAARSIIDGAVFEVTSDLRARFPPARFEPYKSIPDADFAGRVQHHRAESRRVRARPLRCRDHVSESRDRRVRDQLSRYPRRQGLSPAAHRGRTSAVQVPLRQPQNRGREGPGDHADGRGGDRIRRASAVVVAAAALALGGRRRDVVLATGRLLDRRGAGLEPLLLPDRRATRRRPAGGRQRRDVTGEPGRARGSYPGDAGGAAVADAPDADLLHVEPAPRGDHRREQVPDRGGRRPVRRPLSSVPAVPRRRDVERQGHGSADVAKGVPQQQPRVHDSTASRCPRERRRRTSPKPCSRPTSAPACSPTPAS